MRESEQKSGSKQERKKKIEKRYVSCATDLFESGGNQFLIVISFSFFCKNVYKPLTHMIRNVARCYSINFGEQIKTVSNRKI